MQRRVGAEGNVGQGQLIVAIPACERAVEECRVIERERGGGVGGEADVGVRRARELDGRTAGERRAAAAADCPVHCDAGAAGRQVAAVDQRAFDHQGTAARGRERAGVGHRVAAGVDHQRVAAVGDDRAGVDQRHLPGADLARAGDRVVGVVQRGARRTAEDRVAAVVGQRDVPAALQRNALDQHLELRRTADGTERDGPAVHDRAAERQDRPVADGHGAAIDGYRLEVELEVGGAEVSRVHAKQRDRRAGGQRNHRVAVGVVGDRELAELRDAKTDEIDLVGGRVEVVNGVVRDRLRKDQRVGGARGREVIVGGDGKDRVAGSVGFDVVVEQLTAGAAVRVGPGQCHRQHQCPVEAGGSRDRQRARVAGHHRPGAIAVVTAFAQRPACGNAADVHRHVADMVGGHPGQAEVDRAAGNARRRDRAVVDDDVRVGDGGKAGERGDVVQGRDLNTVRRVMPVRVEPDFAFDGRRVEDEDVEAVCDVAATVRRGGSRYLSCGL